MKRGVVFSVMETATGGVFGTKRSVAFSCEGYATHWSLLEQKGVVVFIVWGDSNSGAYWNTTESCF